MTPMDRTVRDFVDREEWNEDDQRVLDRCLQSDAPIILAVNKVDKLSDKSSLLPLLQSLSERAEFAALVPLSALFSALALAVDCVRASPR